MMDIKGKGRLLEGTVTFIGVWFQRRNPSSIQITGTTPWIFYEDTYNRGKAVVLNPLEFRLVPGAKLLNKFLKKT
ncbi:hypothetical protein [Tolypothrix bouteillei]|uniref:hypothetical protein n=1 Tax=Tolypothrix bouteillei TaxID=1246981 RepID=UPI0038B44941